MNNAFAAAPPEETLSHIETLLEQIYDQLQALRDESSQDWFLTREIQNTLRQAERDLQQGDTALFTNASDLLDDLHSHVQN